MVRRIRRSDHTRALARARPLHARTHCFVLKKAPASTTHGGRHMDGQRTDAYKRRTNVWRARTTTICIHLFTRKGAREQDAEISFHSPPFAADRRRRRRRLVERVDVRTNVVRRPRVLPSCRLLCGRSPSHEPGRRTQIAYWRLIERRWRSRRRPLGLPQRRKSGVEQRR